MGLFVQGSLLVSVVLSAILAGGLLFFGGLPAYWGFALTFIGLSLIASLFFHRQLVWDFLTLRTTKHGMGMGATILLATVILVAINILAVRYDKSFDWTKQGVHSLAPQTIQVLDGLAEEVEFVILLGDRDRARENLHQTRRLLERYQAKTDYLKIVTYDLDSRPDLIGRFGMRGEHFALFLVSGEREVRLRTVTEQEVTNSLLRLNRDQSKRVYYLTGHGQREFDDESAAGVSLFFNDLRDSYDISILNWRTEEALIPDDADLLILVGPQDIFTDQELQVLRDYMRVGGRLFLAIDPGLRHGLARLTKSLGVEFLNNYVMEVVAQGGQQGLALTVSGSVFPSQSSITRDFKDRSVLFHMASQLRKTPPHQSISLETLVQSGPRTVALSRLDGGKIPGSLSPEVSRFGVWVEGLLTEEASIGDEEVMSAVILGDSDFLNNTLYLNGVNRDFALNAVGALLGEEESLSIRPTHFQASPFNLTPLQANILFYGLLWPIPLILFGIGFFFWLRRRAL